MTEASASDALFDPDSLDQPPANWVLHGDRAPVSPGTEVAAALDSYAHTLRELDQSLPEFQRWNERWNAKLAIVYRMDHPLRPKRAFKAETDPTVEAEFHLTDAWLELHRKENDEKQEAHRLRLLAVEQARTKCARLIDGYDQLLQRDEPQREMSLREVRLRMKRLWPSVKDSRYGTTEAYGEYLGLQQRAIRLVGRPAVKRGVVRAIDRLSGIMATR